MRRLSYLLALCLAAYAGAAIAVLLLPGSAECITDSECMALCPVDDLDCDGGPQS